LRLRKSSTPLRRTNALMARLVGRPVSGADGKDYDYLLNVTV